MLVKAIDGIFKQHVDELNFNHPNIIYLELIDISTASKYSSPLFVREYSNYIRHDNIILTMFVISFEAC